jgi:hypothetical protein
VDASGSYTIAYLAAAITAALSLAFAALVRPGGRRSAERTA